MRRPQVPASCRDLDLARVERTLFDAAGSFARAARKLGVPSGDLRRMVSATPSLADAVFERLELEIEAAHQVLLNGLRNEDRTKRLKAAAFIVRYTEAGRRRGFG
jgi:hypothetical protein